MMALTKVMRRCGVSGTAQSDQQAQGQNRTHRIYSNRAIAGSDVGRKAAHRTTTWFGPGGLTVTGGLECTNQANGELGTAALQNH
jgi:hypothetical protein